MLKLITVISMLVLCCHCLESTDMLKEDSRARKKNPARLLAMILLFVVSKLAIFKVASFFMLMTVFQKLFYMAGLVISYFMKNQIVNSVPVVPQSQPQATYGLPQDYNTIGYSYGPPEREPLGPEGSLPNIAEYGTPFSG